MIDIVVLCVQEVPGGGEGDVPGGAGRQPPDQEEVPFRPAGEGESQRLSGRENVVRIQARTRKCVLIFFYLFFHKHSRQVIFFFLI